MKYKFIENNKYSFTIKGMCHALLVNPSAYYAWKKRGSSKRTMQDDLILKEIKQVYTDSRKRCYGSPRMTSEIIERGISCGVKRIARIMRVNNLKAQIRRKHSYKKSKNTAEYISENILNRNFTQLVIDAFNKAYLLRNPGKGLIVHSDRGCQYTSFRFKKHLELTNCVQSMSRPGNCWDNACAESFFSHLKSEIIFGEYFRSVYDVNLKVFSYIEGFYNRERRHSSSMNLSPLDYENKMIA